MAFESLITIVFILTAIYLFCGLIFAIPFVIKGAEVIDDGVQNSGWGFRLLIVPGSIIFWPILLKKWIKSKFSAHDSAA